MFPHLQIHSPMVEAVEIPEKEKFIAYLHISTYRHDECGIFDAKREAETKWILDVKM